MYVKRGEGSGVKVNPDIASDFKMWLAPSMKLALLKFMRSKRQEPYNKYKNYGLMH